MEKKKYVTPLVEVFVTTPVYLLTYSSDLSNEDATEPAKGPLFGEDMDDYFLPATELFSMGLAHDYSIARNAHFPYHTLTNSTT